MTQTLNPKQQKIEEEIVSSNAHPKQTLKHLKQIADEIQAETHYEASFCVFEEGEAQNSLPKQENQPQNQQSFFTDTHFGFNAEENKEPLIENDLKEQTAQNQNTISAKSLLGLDKDKAELFSEPLKPILEPKQPMSVKPKKLKTQNKCRKILQFLEKNPNIPNSFIFFIARPNPEERKTYFIPKSVNLIDIVVWDKENDFAFFVNPLEVVPVKHGFSGVAEIMVGNQSWPLKNLLTEDKLLPKFKVLCQNKNLGPLKKETQKLLSEFYYTVVQKPVVEFGILSKFQEIISNSQSNNVSAYQTAIADFEKCIKAKEKLKNFMKKLS